MNKGRDKKNVLKIMENSVKGPEPPPPIMEKNKVIFSETRPFFITFGKKCIFTIENSKKLRKFFKK